MASARATIDEIAALPMNFINETTPNLKGYITVLIGDGTKMNHARYIPPRRWRDRTPRRWRDRFAIRRLALAAVVTVVVALIVFLLIYRRV
jgi:hypothetical protein